jgi:hypothetical protein
VKHIITIQRNFKIHAAGITDDSAVKIFDPPVLTADPKVKTFNSPVLTFDSAVKTFDSAVLTFDSPVLTFDRQFGYSSPSCSGRALKSRKTRRNHYGKVE